jgi:hypothetical protein
MAVDWLLWEELPKVGVELDGRPNMLSRCTRLCWKDLLRPSGWHVARSPDVVLVCNGRLEAKRRTELE